MDGYLGGQDGAVRGEATGSDQPPYLILRFTVRTLTADNETVVDASKSGTDWCSLRLQYEHHVIEDSAHSCRSRQGRVDVIS